MRILIDIDEDVRIAISRMGLLRIPDEMQKKVDKAIQHGTPLDKIRAEIAEIPKKYPMTMDYENGLKEALAIIDKYKAESER